MLTNVKAKFVNPMLMPNKGGGNLKGGEMFEDELKAKLKNLIRIMAEKEALLSELDANVGEILGVFQEALIRRLERIGREVPLADEQTLNLMFTE